jgi:hypothetical protein
MEILHWADEMKRRAEAENPDVEAPSVGPSDAAREAA